MGYELRKLGSLMQSLKFFSQLAVLTKAPVKPKPRISRPSERAFHNVVPHRYQLRPFPGQQLPRSDPSDISFIVEQPPRLIGVGSALHVLVGIRLAESEVGRDLPKQGTNLLAKRAAFDQVQRHGSWHGHAQTCHGEQVARRDRIFDGTSRSTTVKSVEPGSRVARPIVRTIKVEVGPQIWHGALVSEYPQQLLGALRTHCHDLCAALILATPALASCLRLLPG